MPTLRMMYLSATTLLTCVITQSASSNVVEYTNKVAWQNAAGNYSTITFTELPANTWITNHYSHLGATFTDGSDQTMYVPDGFVNDDYGLNGAFDESILSGSNSVADI